MKKQFIISIALSSLILLFASPAQAVRGSCSINNPYMAFYGEPGSYKIIGNGFTVKRRYNPRTFLLYKKLRNKHMLSLFERRQGKLMVFTLNNIPGPDITFERRSYGRNYGPGKRYRKWFFQTNKDIYLEYRKKNQYGTWMVTKRKVSKGCYIIQ